MPGSGFVNRNGLEQNEMAAIPLANERVDVEINMYSALVGKGEERATVDVKGLHIPCSMRLQRLPLDKAPPPPLDHLKTVDETELPRCESIHLQKQ